MPMTLTSWLMLRARRSGDEVVLSWPDLPPLLDGEHVHVRRADGDPSRLFAMVSGEGHVAPTWSEPVAASPPLAFYRVRLANACEDESSDGVP